MQVNKGKTILAGCCLPFEKTLIIYSPATFMIDKIEVTRCLEDIISQLLPDAAERKCQLKNNLSPGITLPTNKEAFAFVIERLLKLIIYSSYNSTIYISNRHEGDKFSLVIKDDNNDYSGYISGKMEKHQSIMKNAGCYLSFEFSERKSITVILSFTNNQHDQTKG